MIHNDVFKTYGMNQDNSLSVPVDGMSYENMNLRVTTTDNNTWLHWTNEQGTKEIVSYVDMEEKSYTHLLEDRDIAQAYRGSKQQVIGQAIIGNYYVIFATTTSSDVPRKAPLYKDAIYRINFTTDNNTTVGHVLELYRGDLNFSVYNPIETLPFYENEEVQKVYWIDGLNPFRCIEVTNDNKIYTSDRLFTVTENILNIKNVNILKDTDSGSGSFPSGVIQYCFTCLNYYGAESGISYITPIHYITNEADRGGNPEETNSVTFTLDINITGENKNKWKYIRVYSLIRTSVNGTPIVKHLEDIKLNKSNTYTLVDNNANGEIISPTDLYYKGSRTIIPNAMAQTFNTLFLGNFSLKRNTLEDYNGISKNDFKNITIEWELEDRYLEMPKGIFPYKYSLDSNSFNTTHFKRGEWYRFGIVLQYESGEMSEVIYIGDSECPYSLGTYADYNVYQVPIPKIKLGQDYIEFLKYNNIKNVFPVIVHTDYNDCSVLAQGVCNPTVYNVEDRISESGYGSPFSQPSWYFRPYLPYEAFRKSDKNHSDNYEDLFTIKYDLEVSSAYKGRSFNSLFNVDIYSRSSKYTYLYSPDTTALCDDLGLNTEGGIIDNDGYIPINLNTFNSSISNIIDYSFTDFAPYGVNRDNFVYPVPSYSYEKGDESAALNKLPVGIKHYNKNIVYNPEIPRMGSWVEFRHDLPIPSSSERNGEIQSNYIYDYNYTDTYTYDANTTITLNGYSACTPYYRIDPTFKHGVIPKNYNPWGNISYASKEEYERLHKNNFFIDYNNITLHSPEFEFENFFHSTSNTSKSKLRIIGIVPISSNVTDYDIQTTEEPLPFSRLEKMQKGLISETIGEKVVDFTDSSHIGVSHFGYRGLVSAPIWEDDIDGRDANLISTGDGSGSYREAFALKTRYVIYPWHSNYLNNGKNKGVINTKLFCNNRYSYNTVYFDSYTEVPHEDIIVTDEETKLYKFKNYLSKEQNYYGNNIDKIVVPSFNSNYILGANNKHGYPIMISGQAILNDKDRPKTAYKAGSSKTKEGIGRFIDHSDFDGETIDNSQNHIVPAFNTAYKGDLFSGKYHRLCDTCWLSDNRNGQIPVIDSKYDDEDLIDSISLNIGGNYLYQYMRNLSPGSRFYFDHYYNKQDATGVAFRWLFGYRKLRTDMEGEDESKTSAVELVNMTNVHSLQPCQIRYKTSNHAFISLGTENYSGNEYLQLLPKIKYYNNIGKVNSTDNVAVFDLPKNCQYFWLDRQTSNCKGSIQHLINRSNAAKFGSARHYGYLMLAELYRDVDPLIRFGGTSETAIENNKWIIGGLKSAIDTTSTELDIEWRQGDFYYQRYNNILTKPFSNTDKNSIVDTLSFMVETRINLDGGAYSKTKAPITSYINFENLNRINSVYSQKNNYFTYYAVNEDKVNLENFENTITWTLPKIAGSLTDNWLNINVTNTLDLDGSLGKITALKSYNNIIMAFQDKAVSVINYNNRVQINPSDNVPIEIANSGKVDGYTIISDKHGCQNKWSICGTQLGLYFIDNISKDIYLTNPFGQNKIESVAASKSMRSFILNNSLLDPWDPIDMNNFVTYYDKEQKDVYFINKDYALSFNEQFGYFTSFYSYNSSPYFAAVNDYNIWIHDSKLWEHRKGKYNEFFGYMKPFYTSVIAGGSNKEGNTSRYIDKVFNNIEFRSDSFDHITNKYLHEVTYDTLEVDNEYQYALVDLENIKDKPTNLKKKFRIWHINIPRNQNLDKYGRGKRDRIRNPWVRIKLSKEKNIGDIKTTLHDLTVQYYD